MGFFSVLKDETRTCCDYVAERTRLRTSLCTASADVLAAGQHLHFRLQMQSWIHVRCSPRSPLMPRYFLFAPVIHAELFVRSLQSGYCPRIRICSDATFLEYATIQLFCVVGARVGYFVQGTRRRILHSLPGGHL